MEWSGGIQETEHCMEHSVAFQQALIEEVELHRESKWGVKDLRKQKEILRNRPLKTKCSWKHKNSNFTTEQNNIFRELPTTEKILTAYCRSSDKP